MDLGISRAWLGGQLIASYNRKQTETPVVINGLSFCIEKCLHGAFSTPLALDTTVEVLCVQYTTVSYRVLSNGY